MKPANTQTDKGLGFDGSEVQSTRGVSKNFCYNQHTGHANDGREVRYGKQMTKGNVTGKATPGTAAVPAVPAQGSVRDNINRGAQVRTPGGTRKFEPSKTQNFQGNADRINAGPGPRKGNQ